jgi:small subunit ribosomal protein S18
MGVIASKSSPVAKTKLGAEDELTVSTVDEKEVTKVRRKMVVVPDKCAICEAGVAVDYKDVYRLKRFTSRRGRMIPRSRSGLCSKHQRQVAQAIKRARFMALLPYVADD